MTGIRAASVVLGGRSVAARDLARHRSVVPPRDVARLRIPDIDEDHVTLAIAALRDVLRGRSVSDVGRLFLVGRFETGDVQTVLTALDAPHVAVSTFAADAAAAADALLVALSGDAATATLIVAADDARASDALHGAGAVGFWLDAEAPVRLAAVDHRRSGDLRAAVAAVDAPQAALALHGPRPEAVARALGAKATPVDTQREDVGDLGLVAPFVALVSGLVAPQAEAGTIWVVPDGSAATGLAARFEGRLVDVRDVRAAAAVPSVESPAEVADGVLVAWQGEGAVPQGAAVSDQAWALSLPARLRLEAAVCADGHVLFPPRSRCIQCAAMADGTRRLSGRGTVVARTRIGAGGGPTEFDPLQAAVGGYGVAIVELDEGPRVAAMLTGPGADDVAMGAAVMLETRILYQQHGQRRYGFKAVAVPRQEA